MLKQFTFFSLLIAATTLVSLGPASAQGPQPPGKLIDIGGHRLHLLCSARASRPLVVISAGRLSYNAEDRKTGPSLREKLHAHVKSEAFLATLSLNSRFVVARRSFHQVHLYEPDLVTDAILQVVMAVRSGKKLGSAK